MSATRIISVAMLIPLALGGCSGSSAPKPFKSDPRPEVYEPAYRVATELRAAQEVGMNRQRFGELLVKFASELSLAKDRADTPREQQLIHGYAEVLQIYKDAAAIWDVKISIPELTHTADEQAKMRLVGGSLDPISQSTDFKVAVIEGIPLNFYPEGSTGLDDLVTHYQLPVTNSEGWKTIPNDSVERVWSRARAKTEEVVKMQKS